MREVINKEEKPSDKTEKCHVLWQGPLQINYSRARVKMHFVAGNPDIAKKLLPEFKVGSPPIKIKQRMELEQSKLREIKNKIKNSDEFCILVALPVGRSVNDFFYQWNNLKKDFIDYLESKTAVGIINASIEGSSEPSHVIHVFPPTDVTYPLLKDLPHHFLETLQKLPHVMMIITPV